MNKLAPILLTLFISLFTALVVPSASAGPFGVNMPKCNECHSKNPKMQAMHKALEYKDCFNCHGPTAKVLDKARLKEQRKTDIRCVKCHGPTPTSTQSMKPPVRAIER